ncbi:hypothetical protein AAD018_006665 [Aestuariibius insulae]|uniref:hypothetical protein n=1 Tax=Aestuariibius insulae TaxID=2058287 RepID=UPI00398E8CD2
MNARNLARNALDGRRMKPVALIAHQGFTGDFQKNPSEGRLPARIHRTRAPAL